MKLVQQDATIQHYELRKCSEGLGFNHFYVQSPCNPLIEDYIELFYMIDEGNVRPFNVR
jgi:hypothetical protein